MCGMGASGMRCCVHARATRPRTQKKCYSIATPNNNYLDIAVTSIRRTPDQGSLIIWHRMSRGTVAVSVIDWFCMILYQISLSDFGSRGRNLLKGHF
jgi:hypothetical protein